MTATGSPMPPALGRRRLVVAARRQRSVPADHAGRPRARPGRGLAAGQDRPAVAAGAGDQQVRAVPQRRHDAVGRPAQLRRRAVLTRVLDGALPHARLHRRQRRAEPRARHRRSRCCSTGCRSGPGSCSSPCCCSSGPCRRPCRRRSSRGCSTTSSASSTTCSTRCPAWTCPGHDWFANPTQGLAVVTIVVVWGAIPLLAISLHAGITQIPQDVLEAARCDGAGPWASFRHVILPFLRPLLVILTTLSVIWDFGVFNQIWFMRNGHPGAGLPDARHLHVLERREQQPVQHRRDAGRADDPRAAAGDGRVHPPAVPDR